MLNYGEELAYWYLRFNGFFIITNFVLHYEQENKPSDFDLLAIRFPHERKKIKGRTLENDQNLIRKLNNDKIIGLICEVKTGRKNHPKSLYNETYLLQALDRFGFIEDNSSYTNELKNRSIIDIEGKYQVGKVYIAEGKPKKFGCINISLNTISEFIKKRIKEDIGSKYMDRMRFPSSLLQYIIWQEHSIN